MFDQGVPAPLRDHLAEHDIKSAYQLGWSELSNGELLSKAEAGFDLLITTDQNLPHQQNLSGRRLAVLVLPTTSWPVLQKRISEIASAVSRVQPGQYLLLE